METRSNNILVGVVTLGMLALVAFFILWLAQAGQGDRNEYDIFFKQSVAGLNKGSGVSFAGVPSGQVKEISLWKDDPEFVRVRIEINEEVPILQGTTATISGVGFTGVSEIQLDGAIKGAPPITQDGPAGVPVIPTKPGALGELLSSAPQLLERISTLTERLTELLSDRNQASIAGILDNMEALTSELSKQGPEISATLQQTRIAIEQAGNAAEQIGELADTSDKLLNEDGRPLMADLRKTIQSAQRSMVALEGVITEAQPGVQAFSKKTIPEANALIRDLRKTSQSLAAVAERLDNGGATSILGPAKLPDYKAKK
ncbi:MAG: MCE family protein [Sphingomonadales bacterium]|nr:MCE family protein [Sphingomonadales bacterium]